MKYVPGIAVVGTCQEVVKLAAPASLSLVIPRLLESHVSRWTVASTSTLTTDAGEPGTVAPIDIVPPRATPSGVVRTVDD
jgi:hypothetical protein